MIKQRTYILSLDGPCNQKCLFCMKTEDIERKPKKSYASVIKEIKNASVLGYKCIDFYRGEPTTYSFLKEAVSFANLLGLEVTLATNGVMFASLDFTTRFFKETDIYGVRVSLHSDIPTVHDKITQVRGSWKSTISGIKNILRFNDRLSVNVVITALNYKQPLRIAHFIYSLGVKGIKYSGICLAGRILEHKDIYVSYESFRAYLIDALKVCKKLNFKLIEIEKMPSRVLEEVNLKETAQFRE